MPTKNTHATSTLSALSVREAAYSLSVKEKTVNQAIDRATLQYVRGSGRRPRKAPRTVRVPALLEFALQAQVSELLTFTKAGKAALKQELKGQTLQARFAEIEAQLAALQAATPEVGAWNTLVKDAVVSMQKTLRTLEVSVGPLRLSVEKILEPILETMAEVALSRSVVIRDAEIRGGEPIVRGTRIPVYMLAELHAQGVTDEVLLSEYESLTPDLLQQALLYAELHPRAGRPKQSAAPWRETTPIFQLATGATVLPRSAKKVAKPVVKRMSPRAAVAR